MGKKPFTFMRRRLIFCVCQKILNKVVRYNVFFKDVCAGFAGFSHTDDLCKIFSAASLECCNNFLCPGIFLLFDFFM